MYHYWTYHVLSQLLTFVCTIVIDKFYIHFCNWQLFYALFQLKTVEYSMLQEKHQLTTVEYSRLQKQPQLTSVEYLMLQKQH